MGWEYRTKEGREIGMKRCGILIFGLTLAGFVSADWKDDFNSYADDAAIKAVYGAGGAFSSPYGTDSGTAPKYI